MINIKRRPPNPALQSKKHSDIGSCQLYNPKDYFADSYLTEIYLNEGMKAAIIKQVEESLQREPTHEVGGFLLGYQRSEQSICVEEYLPARAIAASSPNRLHFGNEALIKLDTYLHKKQNLALMGWFHTHTAGRSPYLSPLDLRIHDGFFRKNYQIAIVTDAKTAAFETGIFTRQENGKMNNLPEQQKTFYWEQK